MAIILIAIICTIVFYSLHNHKYLLIKRMCKLLRNRQMKIIRMKAVAKIHKIRTAPTY